jgi:hypothetical protein
MRSFKMLGSGSNNCFTTSTLIEEKTTALGVSVEGEKIESWLRS